MGFFSSRTKPHTQTLASRLQQPQNGHSYEQELFQVISQIIGRNHSGKTALLRALPRSVMADFFPSGLNLNALDPLAVASMLQQDRATWQALREEGLPTTLSTDEIRYRLYEGEQPHLELITNEAVGQILVNTTADSPPEQLEEYESLLKRLGNSQVVWGLISCPPPEASAEDRERFQQDLTITNAYLRETLRRHPSSGSIAVGLVLTKVDSLFDSEQAARAEMSDDVLNDSLAPLVKTIQMSPKVGEGVIVPTSALGWQNAQRIEELEQVVFEEEFGVDPNPPRGIDLGEPEYILKPGAVAEPFNLPSLMAWTLLAGSMLQEVDCPPDREPDIARICRMLADDLHALGGWIVPVKGTLV